jgi:hypothetical protein
MRFTYFEQRGANRPKSNVAFAARGCTHRIHRFRALRVGYPQTLCEAHARNAIKRLAKTTSTSFTVGTADLGFALIRCTVPMPTLKLRLQLFKGTYQTSPQQSASLPGKAAAPLSGSFHEIST